MSNTVLRKLILTALVLPAVFLTTIGLGHQYRIHLSNKWQNSVELPITAAGSRSERILVFAPHCDDETLGTGGALYRASKSGANVRVVLMTNGDGFRVAAERALHKIKLKPQEYVEFAYSRQQETLNALSMLGVHSDKVTFLGYPDKGLVPMWTNYWTKDRLYPSFYTKYTRSPYVNAYTKNVGYCGENVLSDVESILKKFEPATIYIPHPSDAHPDHYATYCFVMAAVEQLKSARPDWVKQLRIKTYLVHRGDWPVPKGFRPNLHLAPPAALANMDTKWEALPLPEDVIKLKRSAILAHKTQVAMMKSFLLTFARENELFGELQTRIIPVVKVNSIKIDGQTEDWHHIAPAIQDPTDDNLLRELYKSADVQSVYLATDNSKLYVRIDYVNTISSRARYRLGIRGIGSSPDDSKQMIEVLPGKSTKPDHLMYAWRNRTLELEVPLKELASDPKLFVSAETYAMKTYIDKTGWRVFEIQKPSHSTQLASKKPRKS